LFCPGMIYYVILCVWLLACFPDPSDEQRQAHYRDQEIQKLLAQEPLPRLSHARG
jgi:hypothetical protein